MKKENKDLKSIAGEDVHKYIRSRVLNSDHSMELVATINGVEYINDSIAINADKTWESLKAMNGNVVLIIGGSDASTDFSLLEELIVEKVDSIIAIGNDVSAVFEKLAGKSKLIVAASDLKEAVLFAAVIAKKGHSVLFSPACPSFHAFDNYKNRGEDFKRLVKTLIH